MSTKKAVVLLSGGMDSTTVTYEAIERGYQPYLLHTSYGQQTEDKELECAKKIHSQVDGGDFQQIRVDHLSAIGGSSLTDETMAVDEVDLDSDDVPSSYVPFRNANLLSIAVSYAEVNDCDAIFIGAHTEDFSGYPDCRPAFFDAFQSVINAGTKDGEIELCTPFVEYAKSDIVERGQQLDVPFEDTWSCYQNTEAACGVCDACAYRLQAFEKVGIDDPIEYATRPSYE
jgi:7-cyano-7-deazaguanine synthase